MGRCIIAMSLLSASFLFSATRITMEIDSNVEFDLSLSLYPPLTFPSYYFPTRASPINLQGINLEIQYQRQAGGHSVSTLYLYTRGSGNFTPSILLNQLFFAPDGEPLPLPGTNPPGGNWRAYSTLFQQIEQFAVVDIHQTFVRPQDFVFQVETDDEPTNSSVTIYYRVFGL
jgi:hypothetical protein